MHLFFRGLLVLVLLGPLDVAGQDNTFVPAPEISPKSEESVIAIPDRPILRNFPKDLAENSLGLVSRDNFLPFLAGVGAASAAHAVDGSVRDYFARVDRLGRFEQVGEHAGHQPIVFGAVSGLLTLGQLTGNDRFTRFTYDLAQAELITSLMTFGLKHSVGRSRPNGENYLSFPSGHTSTAVTAATIFGHHYGPVAAVAGYVAAGFVATSRMDAGKHYLSDVVSGATIGYIVARTVTKQGERRVRRLEWAPLVSPGTRTLGVNVSWQLGQ